MDGFELRAEVPNIPSKRRTSTTTGAQSFALGNGSIRVRTQYGSTCLEMDNAVVVAGMQKRRGKAMSER